MSRITHHPNLRLPSHAHHLAALRYSPHDRETLYRVLLEGNGPDAVGAALRTAYASNHITCGITHVTRDAGVLVVHSAICGLIDHYRILSQQSWHWWTHASALRPITTTCPTCLRASLGDTATLHNTTTLRCEPGDPRKHLRA